MPANGPQHHKVTQLNSSDKQTTQTTKQAARLALIVPTLNPGKLWTQWLERYKLQTRRADKMLVINSNAADPTPAIAKRYGFEVIDIPPNTFDHGKTRQLGVSWAKGCDYCLFLTQDALLADPHSIANILNAIEHQPNVACAYGRQLPHTFANPIAAHARSFNYPDQPALKTFGDRKSLGIKAAFSSNAFAIYRREAILKAGGFPEKIIS